MDHTAVNMETQITLLPLLLKLFAMFKMRLWYDNKNSEETVVDDICIRYSHCGKTTGLSVKNTNYKDMVTKCFSNKVLHIAGFSRIFKTNQQLEYDIYETFNLNLLRVILRNTCPFFWGTHWHISLPSILVGPRHIPISSFWKGKAEVLRKKCTHLYQPNLYRFDMSPISPKVAIYGFWNYNWKIFFAVRVIIGSLRSYS